ncbi:MAG: hypothetical protein KatS3mg087_0521 [Patescibacteria group bacterium]|nr:MAG: hypothetical protein KatS3mg087_0521 [Patescibacteria group bacterium]
MSYFNKGDIVQMEDGRVCTVVYDPGEGEIVHLRLPDKSSGNFHRSQLKLISTAPTDNADSAIAPIPSDDELISELIKQNPLSWQEIQIFCKGDVAKLKLIQSHKKSKKLAKDLSGMYENYLIETGDISDKSWLPQEFVDLLSDGVPF